MNFSQNMWGVLLSAIWALTSQTALAQSADAFVIKRPSELRSAPGETSPSLGPLAIATPITRLTARQGAWVEVNTTQGTTGWVHMFDMTTAAAAAQSGGSGAGFLRGVGSLFGGKSTQTAANTGATSTIGIRGLGAEDIANTQPNLAAVAQVEGMRVDAVQARRFASDATLTAHTVDPLPVPAPPAPPRQNNNSADQRPPGLL
jgi:hypothetical protein